MRLTEPVRMDGRVSLLLPFLLSALLHAGRTAHFAHQPSDQVVVAGRSVTLPCIVVGYRGTVQWTMDGLALGAERDLPGWSRYSIVGDPLSGEHNLLIDSVELGDDAIYECQATQAALRSQRAHLSVLVPPGDPLIRGAPTLHVLLDSPYNLTCLAPAAKPAADIVWFRDGKQLNGALYSKHALSDGKSEDALSSLLITPSFADAGSRYTCHVWNSALPEGREGSVTLSVQYPPKVTLSVNPPTVSEGGSVSFVCSAVSNPEVTTYRWAKGGVPIPVSGDSYHAAADHTFFTAPVSCEVSNSVGSSNVSTAVNVLFGPRLLTEPRPMAVDVGGDASFFCGWTGNPTPTQFWNKKGSSEVLSNGNTLSLNKVTREDAGTYVCKAIVPRIGTMEKEVTLTVRGPPVIASDTNYESVLGGKARMECLVETTPIPDRIIWTWDKHILDEGSVGRFSVETRVTSNHAVSFLIIDGTEPSDYRMQYNCTAINQYGEDSAIISLKEEATLPLMLLLIALGLGTLCLFVLVTICVLCCRRPRKEVKDTQILAVEVSGSEHSDRHPSDSEEDLKEPLHTDTESRGTSQTEHSDITDDPQDPTNGYYKVRAHDDSRPTTVAYPEFSSPPRPLYSATTSLTPLCPTPSLPGAPKLYDYAHRYATTPRQGSERIHIPQGPCSISTGPSSHPAPYARAFCSYVRPDQFETLESGPTRLSYASLSTHCDYGRPAQRMQTHV